MKKEKSLVINYNDRFEITKKGKEYLRKEKDSKRKTNKVIKK